MKRGVLLILVLGAGSVFAQQPTMERDKAKDKSDAGKTVNITAEVVAADPDAKTITVRPAAPSSTGMSGTAASAEQTRTLMVDTKATASLKSMRFGDKVTLTCTSDGTSGTSGTSGTTATTGTEAGTSPSTMGSEFARNCATVTGISKARAITQKNR